LKFQFVGLVVGIAVLVPVYGGGYPSAGKDDASMHVEFATLPARKDHINIRVDHDVLEWFKASGKGCQTLMNNVLRAFVQSRQSREIRRPK
jgi:hypothetical protein